MVVFSHLLPLVVGMPSELRGLGHVEDAAALECHIEDAPYHGVGGRVKLQLGALLRPVLDVDLPVAVGGEGGDPEASGSGLPHPSRDLLGKDIGYSIDTKRSGIHGRLDLKPVDNDDCSRSLRGSNPHYRERTELRTCCWEVSI